MTMLVQREPTTENKPYVLADVKAHARVTHSHEDGLFDTMAAQSAFEIEQFAQIALLFQTISVTLIDPQGERGLFLPIGPVIGDTKPTVTIDGVAFEAFEFVSGVRPYIRWTQSMAWGAIGRINVEYQAGFGATADAVPADLAQAISDQAVLLYDARGQINARSLTSSPHLARVGARYRGVRL